MAATADTYAPTLAVHPARENRRRRKWLGPYRDTAAAPAAADTDSSLLENQIYLHLPIHPFTTFPPLTAALPPSHTPWPQSPRSLLSPPPFYLSTISPPPSRASSDMDSRKFYACF